MEEGQTTLLPKEKKEKSTNNAISKRLKQSELLKSIAVSERNTMF
jgi:hypothetical protein